MLQLSYKVTIEIRTKLLGKSLSQYHSLITNIKPQGKQLGIISITYHMHNNKHNAPNYTINNSNYRSDSDIVNFIEYMWCDQAKSVWSRSNSVFIFLTNCMHHFHSYILQKTPLKLVNWFQRYEQLKDAKNNRKQKTFSALFGYISKSIFPTSDWFCLITPHI